MFLARERVGRVGLGFPGTTRPTFLFVRGAR